MNAEEYRLATRETMIYPGAGKATVEALNYLMHGLGEAGEIQGKFKKLLRDDRVSMHTEIDDCNALKVSEIVDELGDLLWYVVRICDEMNLPVEVVMNMNAKKLRDRKARDVIGGSGDAR